ncbi:MAG: DUF4292 domain-containing protein [Flavobacterium sp.]|nr:DUF4292 domain-containing protein [Flavobacterium sp.]
MKNIFVVLLFCLLWSCKSKSILAPQNSGPLNSNENSAKKVIANYYKNNLNFSTLYIKANAKYSDEKQTQNVTAEIKIKKNEIILVTVRFLGFTVAKALITPTSVKYYEKIGSKFFEGNYETLSKWLGADLDFFKMQNLFLGQPVDDLIKENYSLTWVDQMAQLQNVNATTAKTFLIDTKTTTLSRQEINQPNQNRTLQIMYPQYQNINQLVLPLSLNINATTNTKNTNININYRSIAVNEELSFPYSVPEGYEQIFIK